MPQLSTLVGDMGETHRAQLSQWTVTFEALVNLHPHSNVTEAWVTS